MFLAHYTGSGLSQIEDMDVVLYNKYLSSAIDLYQEEINNPKRVVLVGIDNGD